MNEIPLSQGKIALVDSSVWADVMLFNWHYYNGYAARRVNYKIVCLHNYLMNPSPGLEVDHIDGNKLDCRSSNMRLATHKQNSRNRKSRRGTSNYSGVNLDKSKWRARIVVDGQTINLGIFVVEEDAARAYDEAAKKYFGEFARLNFKEEVIK